MTIQQLRNILKSKDKHIIDIKVGHNWEICRDKEPNWEVLIPLHSSNVTISNTNRIPKQVLKPILKFARTQPLSRYVTPTTSWKEVLGVAKRYSFNEAPEFEHTYDNTLKKCLIWFSHDKLFETRITIDVTNDVVNTHRAGGIIPPVQLTHTIRRYMNDFINPFPGIDFGLESDLLGPEKCTPVKHSKKHPTFINSHYYAPKTPSLHTVQQFISHLIEKTPLRLLQYASNKGEAILAPKTDEKGHAPYSVTVNLGFVHPSQRGRFTFKGIPKAPAGLGIIINRYIHKDLHYPAGVATI